MNKINLSKLPEITRGRLDRIRVFSDFLELAAIRISNRVDPVHYSQREEKASLILESYTEAEQEEMLRYFMEISQQIFTNIEAGICEDFFSHVFQESRFSRQGQDQSPPGVAKLVAKLSLGENPVIPPKGYIDLDECSCGSGNLILAYAEAMTDKQLNYFEQLVVRATDRDPKCVHMAYIQLSLYGIPAVVIHGETLALKEYTRWYTPMYIIGKWVWKSPFSLTGRKSRDDELLKRATDPVYDAMRRAQQFFDPIGKYDTISEEDTQND